MIENDEMHPAAVLHRGDERENRIDEAQMTMEDTPPEPYGETFVEESEPEGSGAAPTKQPLIVDMSAITGGAQETEDLSKFQHIVDGFFAQTKEPALTISGKTVTVNAAAVRLFPEVDFMEILINTEGRKVAFEPCTELNIRGYKWAREKDGRRYATTRTGLPFVLCICQIMNWDPNKRYKIRGKKVPDKTGKEILVFDLRAHQGFEKPAPGEKGGNRSTILTGWNGVFGPMYNESESTLQVDTFDGYAFFSIKDGWVQNPEGQNGSLSQEDEEGTDNNVQGGDARNEAENEE